MLDATAYRVAALGPTLAAAFNRAQRKAEYQGCGGPGYGLQYVDDIEPVPESVHKHRRKTRVASELVRLAQTDEPVDPDAGADGTLPLDHRPEPGGPAKAIDCDGTSFARQFRERTNQSGKEGTVWLFFGLQQETASATA